MVVRACARLHIPNMRDGVFQHTFDLFFVFIFMRMHEIECGIFGLRFAPMPRASLNHHQNLRSFVTHLFECYMFLSGGFCLCDLVRLFGFCVCF